MTQQKFVILGALAALSLPGFAGAQNPQPAPRPGAYLGTAQFPVTPAGADPTGKSERQRWRQSDPQRQTVAAAGYSATAGDRPRHPQAATAARRGQHAGDPTAGHAWRQPTGGPEIVPLCASADHLAVAGPAGLPMTRAARAPLSGPLRGMALLGVGFCPPAPFRVFGLEQAPQTPGGAGAVGVHPEPLRLPARLEVRSLLRLLGSGGIHRFH